MRKGPARSNHYSNTPSLHCCDFLLREDLYIESIGDTDVVRGFVEIVKPVELSGNIGQLWHFYVAVAIGNMTYLTAKKSSGRRSIGK